MADVGSHSVDPADEARHRPGEEPLWNESYYLDFVSEDGSLGGYLRVGLYPNLGVTWWTTMLVGPGRPVVASVDYGLPVGDGSGLTLDTGAFSVTATIGRPLVEMSVRGSAPARILPGPEAVYRGEQGVPAVLGVDLVWATDGTAYHYDMTTRYEVPCLVAGTVTVDGVRTAVVGQGQRDHSWGVRDWWAFGWCWAAARLDDGTRVHLADIRIPGQPMAFGYLQTPGVPESPVLPVQALTVTEALGVEGMPTAARALVEPGGMDLAIEPLAFGPVLLVAPDGRISRFPRAMARFVEAGGRSGYGWIEWNQPDPAGGGR